MLEKFVKDGGYLWNSGIFMFKASVYLEILQNLQKDIFNSCENSYKNAVKDLIRDSLLTINTPAREPMIVTTVTETPINKVNPPVC